MRDISRAADRKYRILVRQQSLLGHIALPSTRATPNLELSLRTDGHAVALTRYQSIIDNPESGEIDYDEVEPGTTKPTKAAIRVNDLLETVTGSFRLNK